MNHIASIYTHQNITSYAKTERLLSQWFLACLHLFVKVPCLSTFVRPGYHSIFLLNVLLFFSYVLIQESTPF